MYLGSIPLNIDWQQILLHVLNFVILIGGLYFLLYNPVKKFMEQRKKEYEKQALDAKEYLDNAKSKEEEINKRLSALDEEIAERRIAISKDLDNYHQSAIEQAKEEAKEIINKARKDALKDKEKILEEANSEIKEMLVSATEKLVLQETVNEAYEEFLDSTKEVGDSNEK